MLYRQVVGYIENPETADSPPRPSHWPDSGWVAVDPTSSSVFAVGRANRTAPVGDPVAWMLVDSSVAFHKTVRQQLEKFVYKQ